MTSLTTQVALVYKLQHRRIETRIRSCFLFLVLVLIYQQEENTMLDIFQITHIRNIYWSVLYFLIDFKFLELKM